MEKNISICKIYTYKDLHDSYYSKFQIRLVAKINGHERQLQPLHEYKSELLLHFNRAMLPTELTFTRFPVVKLLLLGGSSESCFR